MERRIRTYEGEAHRDEEKGDNVGRFSHRGELSQAFRVVHYLAASSTCFAHVHLTYNHDVISSATHATHFSYLTLIHHVSTNFTNDTTCLALGTKPRRWTVPSNAGNTFDRSYLSAIICSPDGQQRVDGRTRESKGTGAQTVETPANPTNLTAT